MARRSNWVTMDDVAREAKVSKITVSRVIRTPEKVSLETRERVQAAILALGYVLDELAGSLATGHSHTVAALVSTLDGSAFAPTIDGLTGYLRKNGHELLLGNTDYSAEIEADLVSVVLRRHPVGLVLSSTEHSPELRSLLGRSSVTTVEIWDLPEDPIDMAVGFSQVDAGYAMTRYLCETGRRRIAYIGSGERTIRTRKRYEGYGKALRELGLVEPPLAPYDRSISSVVGRGAASMEWVLENDPGVDAVFCMNDWLALGAIGEVRRRGKSVPDDIAVVGVGNIDFGSERGLGITTLKFPGFEIGETAARLILERNELGREAPKVIDLGFEIVRRVTA